MVVDEAVTYGWLFWAQVEVGGELDTRSESEWVESGSALSAWCTDLAAVRDHGRQWSLEVFREGTCGFAVKAWVKAVVAGEPKMRLLFEKRKRFAWYWSIGYLEAGGDDDLAAWHLGVSGGEGALALEHAEPDPSVERLFADLDGFGIRASQQSRR